MRVGQIVRLSDKRFRIAIVVHVYAAQGQALVCKWLDNGRTWTKPRLVMIGERTRNGATALDRHTLEARLRAVVDHAIAAVDQRAGVVSYRGGEHKIGSATVGTES